MTMAITLLKTDKINGFPGLILKHLYVKLGDRSCIDFLRCRLEKRTNSGENPNHLTAVGVYG